MLRISKLADYATVILHCLACNIRDTLSATDVAQRTHLGRPTVSKILKILQEAGLVISTRGVVGGYRLTRPASAITLAQVIAAIEGQPGLTECARGADLCTQDTRCALKHNWQAIHQFILTTLNQVTLADMNKPFLAQQLLKPKTYAD